MNEDDDFLDEDLMSTELPELFAPSQQKEEEELPDVEYDDTSKGGLLDTLPRPKTPPRRRNSNEQ